MMVTLAGGLQDFLKLSAVFPALARTTTGEGAALLRFFLGDCL
jgi:hypothetical protein